KVRKKNAGKGIIIVLDNFKSHTADLNPIEYIWKSIRRIISTAFIRQIDDMRNVIMGAFYRFSQKLSFAAGWVDRFLQPPIIMVYANDYISSSAGKAISKDLT
ncbi:hypothetical protein M1N83_02850, partial [Dehalococcoidia bacterium]|nr:hypothetical protein [Dehalococcoidia bacterium]